jgi:hypothetical protein
MLHRPSSTTRFLFATVFIVRRHFVSRACRNRVAANEVVMDLLPDPEAGRIQPLTIPDSNVVVGHLVPVHSRRRFHDGSAFAARASGPCRLGKEADERLTASRLGHPLGDDLSPFEVVGLLVSLGRWLVDIRQLSRRRSIIATSEASLIKDAV